MEMQRNHPIADSAAKAKILEHFSAETFRTSTVWFRFFGFLADSETIQGTKRPLNLKISKYLNQKVLLCLLKI
jgi:hypothetical protein